MVAPMAVLLASVIAALLNGGVATRSPDFVMSPRILNVYLVGTFALFLGLSLILAYGYSSERGNRGAEATSPPTPASLIAKPSTAG